MWNAYSTVFGSKRSAYTGTQRPPKSQNTNRFLKVRNGCLRHKLYFVEPDRKILEFNAVLNTHFQGFLFPHIAEAVEAL